MAILTTTTGHEKKRLAALRGYAILDTQPDECFDRIVRLASRQFNVPIALISLIDENRQWFKAACGLDQKEIPRDIAFCAHTILDQKVMVISDAAEDTRFADNPLVKDDLNIRFYAGAPLINAEGYALGTLCLMDDKPREQFNAAEKTLLKNLADVVVDQIEMRYATIDMPDAAETRLRAEDDLTIARHQIGLFFDYVPIAVAIFDRDMRFLACNVQWRELFDLGDQPLAGRALESVNPLFPDEWKKEYQRCLAGEFINIDEDRLKLASDSEHWIHRQMQPWKDDQGEIGGLIFCIDLIDERKQAMIALEQNQQFSQAVLENIPDGIVACDADGYLSLFNRATRNFHQADSAPVPPEQWAQKFNLYAADGRTPLRTEEVPLYRAWQGETVESEEISIRPEVDSVQHVVTSANPMYDGEGRKLGAVASMQDITKVRRIQSQLSALETRFLALFDHTFQFCGFLETDGTLLEANQTALDFGGCSRDQVIGKPFWETPWWRGNDARVEQLKTAVRQAAEGEFVRYQVIADGANQIKMPVDFSLKPIHNQDGKVVTLIAEGRDISEQFAAEEALRRNQAELTLILDNIPIRILYKDDKNRILRLNKSAAESMQMSVEEVEGQNTYNLFPEKAAQYHEDDLEIIESGRAKLGIIEEYTQKSGQKSWIRTDKVPYIDPDTGERFIFAAAVDITAEREAEQALRISEKRYRTLYNSTPVMLYSITPDGCLLSVSDFWLEKFGYERDEVIGRPVTNFMAPESEIRAKEIMFPEFFAERQYKDLEYQFLTKSGQKIDVLISLSAEYDDQDSLLRLMAVLTDITERKKVERQLLQAQKMESVGQLTGGLAHDFNNLLGVVLGNLQLIERATKKNTTVFKQIKAAQSAVDKGAELTRKLLAFSRRQPLEAESVEPNSLIENLSDMLQRTLGETIVLETHLSDAIPRIRTDPSQLESAILNLSVNARDAMPEGGSLTIETELAHLDDKYAASNQMQPGEYVLLSITDTGRGIDQAVINQVFEPFFTTKDTGKSSGLGLSMVYGFMKQIGGHVSIYSEPEHGTTVKLYLPIDPNHELQINHEAEESPPTIRGNNEMILVVEDQTDVREMAGALLEDLGYRVIMAPDGPSGLEILKQREDIDLLFTDMVMPGGMNGTALAIAAREIRPDLPVVFTTGYADAAVLRQGSLVENGNLVTKPYRRDKLGEKIRQALDEAQA